ncbi:MAG: TerC family protein [Alphaproteobacteria bacterium]|nr:TerC family protein [Alphaproteobacteria bacterium]
MFETILFGQLWGTPGWMWLAFIGIVITILALDLGVLHKGTREISMSESLWMCAGYAALAAIFGAWVWWAHGAKDGLDFFTGYVVEYSLAMDNVFAIAMIFTYFAVPREYQHRVLFWGILGVIVMRGIMIALGAALIVEFSWILYVFGAFLVLTGIKMMLAGDKPMDLSKNPVLLWLRRHMRVTDNYHGERFFVNLPDKTSGKIVRHATPLFLCLVLVEAIDLVFAVDSVPAIFAITQDPFIVYTSNIFAIMGLRALYFALAALVHRFRYLKYALAMILVVVGAKIFAVNIVGHVPAWLSLSVTISLLAGGILLSLWKTRGEKAEAAATAVSKA